MPLQSNSIPFEYYNLATQQSASFAELQKLYPGTSFPKELQAFDAWIAVYSVAPPAVDRYQTAHRDGVQQINGKWYTKYSVADMDANAIVAKDVEQAKAARADRNKRLADCDWTQLADSTADKAAWATYRQALRDVPDQAGFPWEITWPVSP